MAPLRMRCQVKEVGSTSQVEGRAWEAWRVQRAPGVGGLQFREWGEPVRLSVLMLAGQLQPSLGNSKAQIPGKAQPFKALQGL